MTASVARSATVGSERDTRESTGPHTTAALLAGVLFVGGLAATYLLGELVASRYIYALAGVQYGQKYSGLVLQREALRHPDLLPLYGTSEVFLENPPYHARDLFAGAPTGFSVFTLGMPGGLVFTSLESLGALGADLNGKKVVISLTPPMFANPGGHFMDVRYDVSFSALQLLTLFTSDALSTELKSDLAKRFLAHPSMLERNTLVSLIVNLYADGFVSPSPFYYAVAPLIHVQRLLLDVQDRALVIAHIATTPEWRDAAKRIGPLRLDWAALLTDAMQKYQPTASENPFGVLDRWWALNKQRVVEQRDESRNDLWYRESDEQFLHDMSKAEAWLDLEQMLRILQELHAQPLILSMPLHGTWWDFARVSPAARRQYYARVRELGARYGVRTLVLDDHEADQYFFRDLGAHLSPVGWLHYDRAIDAFYHDALN